MHKSVSNIGKKIGETPLAHAARMLTAMLLGFGARLWSPLLFRNPTNHTIWAGNAVNLAIGRAAWMMADLLLDRKQTTSQVG